jgi:hypothetical protein
MRYASIPMPFPDEPLCAPLPEQHRIAIAEAEAFVAPVTIDLARATALARDAITGSFARPGDIGGARIDRPRLAYVPFWRVEGSIDGFHIGLGTGRSQSGGTFVFPTGGMGHRDGVAMILARRLFAYGPLFEMNPFHRAPLFGQVLALEVALTELVPRGQARPSPIDAAAEWIDPDVGRAEAEQLAKQQLMRAVVPGSALYANYEPRVRSVAFVHYPLWVTRYEYVGEVRTTPGTVFFVTLAGRSGRVVRAQRPSLILSVANRVRRFLGGG